MDTAALTELRLYMENDSDVYSRRNRDFWPNLDRKVKGGRYDSALAPKLFQYLVDFGAEKYVKEFGSVGRSDTAAIKREARRLFPTEVRRKLAEELRDEYEEEAKERGLVIHKDRHLCNACAEHESNVIKHEGARKRVHHG